METGRKCQTELTFLKCNEIQNEVCGEMTRGGGGGVEELLIPGQWTRRLTASDNGEKLG